MANFFSNTGQTLEHIIVWITSAFRAISGAVLAVIMIITAMDVALRYLFNQPIPGTIELTEVFMSVIIFFGLAYTAHQNEHIRVEILISHLSKRMQAVIESISNLLSAVMIAFVSWQSVVYALKTMQRHQGTLILSVPLSPFYLVVAIGSALLSIILLIQFFHSIKCAASKEWKVKEWLIPLIVIAIIGGTAPLWLSLLPAQINSLTIGYLGIAVLLIIIFLGMPIGIVMLLIAFTGQIVVRGMNSGLLMMGTTPYAIASSYSLSVIPLFVLMGIFCYHSGLSRSLYNTVHKWLGHLPGGLAIATVGACAGFAAVSGSSVASAATMGTVALPEMKRYKYDPSLSTGCIAAGGTLGILIPPSVGFIVYAMLTNQSIGELFIAGILPGILMALVFMIIIYLRCRRNHRLGPPGPATSFKEKIFSLQEVWVIVLLFLLVMGGLYVGVFTPTEAAGVGAFGALIFAAAKRIKFRDLLSSLSNTVVTTSMVFLIIIGAETFSQFLAATNVPYEMAGFLTELGLSRYIILFAYLLLLLVLGCVMDAIAGILLTIPIFFPLVLALGFDPIWFGVICVITMEAGLITPPVGLNAFVISGIAKDVPLYTIFKGIVPFLIGMIAVIIILTVFPQIATVLPGIMK